MNNFLPPPVTRSTEEPTATGGVHALGIPPVRGIGNVKLNRETKTIFTAAHGAVGSEEPIGMSGW